MMKTMLEFKPAPGKEGEWGGYQPKIIGQGYRVWVIRLRNLGIVPENKENTILQ